MTESEQPEVTPRAKQESEDERSESPKFFDKKSHRIIAAVAGVALAAVAGAFAFGGRIGATNERQPTTTETTAANPAQTELQKEVFAALPAMEDKYSKMDVPTFETLPRDERLSYALLEVDLVTASGSYELFYSDAEASLRVKPGVVSLDNTGQEILDSNMYNKQIASLRSTNIKSPDTTGQKILSSVYYLVDETKYTSNSYKIVIESLKTQTNPTTVVGKLTTINTSELQNGTDSNNEAVKYKDVTYKDTSHPADTIYTRFVYHEFNNYDGKPRGVWLTDINSSSIDELNRNSQIK